MSTYTHPDLSEVITWATDQRWSQFAQSLVAQYQRKGSLSQAQVDALTRMYLKMMAKAQAKAQAPVNPDPVTEPGMYAKDGAVYRVKCSEAGHLYAMRFDPSGATKSERFTYAKGVIATLCASDRMTLEQASALGLRFGICCVCGRELTAEKSVDAGIGPVCITRL